MTAVSDPTTSSVSRDTRLPFVVAPEAGLRSFRTSQTPWVWFVGCHGGAGESVLADTLPAAGASDHRWPFHVDGSLPRVVLVARTSLAGIEAARTALTQWAAANTPPVHLLGLVWSADAPGKLPRPLRELSELVAGGVRDRKVWHLPWVEAWRTGDLADRKVTARLFADLARLTEPQEDPR